MKTLFRAACSFACKPFRFIRNCWSECPKAQKCTMLMLSAVLNVVFGLLLLQGCASSPLGIAREQRVYSAGTNVVGLVQQLAPYVPAPVSAPLGLILGGVSAALAAWNLHQQRSLSALKKQSTATAVTTDFASERTQLALSHAKAALELASQAATSGPPPRPGGTPAQVAQP
jgi:hypothetical protein